MAPSGPSETIVCAFEPQSSATACTELLNGSDHDLVDFEYCWTDKPLGPAIAKNCPVQSHRMRSIWPPTSSIFICVDLRRSHIETLVDPLLTAASQVPFSENARDWTGPDTSRLAAFAPDVMTNTLICPSAPPAANRWPSGWNSALVRPMLALAAISFVESWNPY